MCRLALDFAQRRIMRQTRHVSSPKITISTMMVTFEIISLAASTGIAMDKKIKASLETKGVSCYIIISHIVWNGRYSTK
jgi:hypothetical protein